MRNGRCAWRPNSCSGEGARTATRSQETGIARRWALASTHRRARDFPKAMVNRMWGVFGRGFVNPSTTLTTNNQCRPTRTAQTRCPRGSALQLRLKKLIRWITPQKPIPRYCGTRTNDKARPETISSHDHEVAFTRAAFLIAVTATKRRAGRARRCQEEPADNWPRSSSPISAKTRATR